MVWVQRPPTAWSFVRQYGHRGIVFALSVNASLYRWALNNQFQVLSGQHPSMVLVVVNYPANTFIVVSSL